MKRIGILYDKDTKQTILLPQEVKTLVNKGVTVSFLQGVGACVNVSDDAYISAGAHICNSWQAVVNSSDILLKANAFNKSELVAMRGKIAITLANYLVNVEMLFYMLQNNITGLEWKALTDHSGYPMFDQVEEAKAPLVIKYFQDALKTGLIKSKKDIVVYPKDPRILILNASPAGVAIAKQAISLGWKVTIAESDEKKIASVKKSGGLSAVEFIDAGYDSLTKKITSCFMFVNTAINPTDVTKLRITKETAQSMPKGSLLIDAACENGYAFYFVKKLADKEIKWNKLGNWFYMAHENLSDLIGPTVSEIVSNKSVKYLLDVADSGVNNSSIWKITNCKDGKVVNSSINSKLSLY